MPTMPPAWPVSKLVIFDCDSTLSTIEGIDVLARMAGREQDVAVMTKRAMEGDLPLESVYGERLVLTRPSQAQVQAIAQQYRETVIADARAVIDALQALGCLVFIVSGGLIEPVRDFGRWLGLPREHIFAVSMAYDQLAGRWWRYWDRHGEDRPGAAYLALEPGPLTASYGKNAVIAAIRHRHPGRALMVGDGLSDLEAAGDVELFVGFGGVAYRQRVAEASPVYIRSAHLSPILPLALGRAGKAPRYASLWTDGVGRVADGEVTFGDADLRRDFLAAMRRAGA
ncbi:MAG: HAD-IB family phosphatase [Caldilineae bacterium]|nr:HAD-IB family phosphatase [Chloroflexota bacterium]MCB9177423.1 HAD-IB family phosphatase [Caldilineae bacterium]